MKVLVTIFEELVPLSGGGTPRTSNIVRSFCRKGHEVYVASSFGVGKDEAALTLGCEDVHPLVNVSRLSKNKMLKYMYSQPANIMKLAAYAGKVKPDMVVSHNSIAGYGAIMSRQGKSVLDLTDVLFEYLDHTNGWTKPVQKVGRRIEKKSITDSDRIITISRAMKEILVDYGAQHDNVDVVYDGVDTSIFKPFDGEELRERHGNGADNIVIFQGVIDPQDGPELLVEAARQVLLEHPRTMFWIVGDGSAVPIIKREAAGHGILDKFFFSGWVNMEEVPRYISASDIGLVILPDILSARGRVTLKEFEYWACGIPAVLPKLPALTEVVEEGATGLFYEPGKAEGLAHRISMLIEDENMKKAMGKAGMKTVKEKYEWSRLTDQFVTLCEGYN